MPTAALRQITAKQDNQALRARLEAEAARVQISYKASVIDFMVMEGISRSWTMQQEKVLKPTWKGKAV